MGHDDRHSPYPVDPLTIAQRAAEAAWRERMLAHRERGGRRRSKRRVRAKLPETLRVAVFTRDDYRCVACGHQPKSQRGRVTWAGLTVDHRVPVSRGGTDDLENLQTMCRPCNHAKGNRMPDIARDSDASVLGRI